MLRDGKQQNMDELLKKVYYDPKSPAAFSGIENILRVAKKSLPTIKRRDVINWLVKQHTYTLHKPVRRKFKRVHYIVNNINEQWQLDLADMVKQKKSNKGLSVSPNLH